MSRFPDLPSRGGWVGRVGDVNEDDTGLALVGPGLRPDGVDEVGLGVGYDVVSSTAGEALEVASEILGVAEDLRGSRVDCEQLLHVEDLDTVSLGLAADDHQVVLATDLTPGAGGRVCWKTSKVYKFAFLVDLSKRSTILLSDCNKLATIVRGPTWKSSALAILKGMHITYPTMTIRHHGYCRARHATRSGGDQSNHRSIVANPARGLFSLTFLHLKTSVSVIAVPLMHSTLFLTSANWAELYMPAASCLAHDSCY